LPLGIVKNNLQNGRHCTNDTLGVDILSTVDLQQKKDQTDESLANAAATRIGGRIAETTK
jgi:hypothetical protein